jgi:eukaryotic-like serine/threonine-protein kinase
VAPNHLVPDPAAVLANALRDRYRLERELGRGGMATVYLAHDLKHDRPVALKILHPELAATLGPERFEREIRYAARLQHPHILGVHDSGEAAGQLWFTMPFVDGESLRDRLRRERQLSQAEALRIATETARALEHAHQHGVIHRDIKPENILLTRDGSALVADFGIARALDGADALTQTGMTIGTAFYMSPEQAAGEPHLDGRTDIYSLGCVLYEMLAGEPPFTGPNVQSVLAKQLSVPAPPLSVVRGSTPLGVERALERALAKSPADRFATAAEFAEALLEAPTAGASAGTVRPTHDTAASRAPGRSRPGRTVVIAGLLLLTAVLGVWVWRRQAGSPALASDPKRNQSIAVLPLANVGGDSAEEYFADGMTDELTNALSKVPGMRVASRTSAYVFKGRRDVDAREIGRRLNVGTLLEGAVRRSGDRLRVTAQLTSADDGLTLWSESYEREPKDVFAVQDEIARSIVGALQGRFAISSALERRHVPNLEAHDLLLQAEFFYRRKTEPDLRKALSLYQAALAKDSGYAEAWAGMSSVWTWLADDWVRPREGFPKAKEAVLRALALDSMLAEGHDALGTVLAQYDWDFAGAEREFRKAIALDPNLAVGYSDLGDVLSTIGRAREGEEQSRKALLLDPLEPYYSTVLAGMVRQQGRYEEAIALYQKALELEPGYTRALLGVAEARIKQGRKDEALEILGRTPEMGSLVAIAKAQLEARAGRREAALRLARELSEASKKAYIRPDGVAGVYASLGERDSAFTWLDRAYSERSSSLIGLNVVSVWDPIRSDPRFVELVRKIGLPARDESPRR